MQAIWALQDAKHRCSEFIDQAVQDGPHVVTHRGKETVVVLAVEAFRKRTTVQDSLAAFSRHARLVGGALELTWDADSG